MQLDPLATFLVAGGLTAAVGIAVLAGKLTARVFFDASAGKIDEEESPS
jgi:hypothetical protein